MRKQTYPNLLAALAIALVGIMPACVQAQDAEDTAAAAEKTGPSILKPADLKWNNNLVWVSFIVDDGRLQSNRDYFGAIEKKDFDGLVGGTAKGMVKVQQVFYYNAATRQFSRFDASGAGTVSILKKSGYFRPDSIMRMVELNKQFVENLAVRKFLMVEGVNE